MKLSKKFYWVPLGLLLVVGFVGYGFLKGLITQVNADAPTITYPITSTPDVTAIWNLDETANGTCTGGGDVCDQNNTYNGTVVGSVPIVDTPTGRGRSFDGTGRSFDGTSGGNYIDLGDSTDFYKQSFVIEATVEMQGTNHTWDPIFSKDAGSDGFSLGINGGNDFEFRINNQTIAVAYTYVNTNEWHTVAAVVDNIHKTVKLYVDNTLGITESYTGSINYTSTPLEIGTVNFGTNLAFNGIIDDVKYYGYNSTDATITSSVYTVSQGTTDNETITYVPESTSKAAFLANLTKGNTFQTWNDSNVSDPVETGDTLVVTAEDGSTVITYHVTVGLFFSGSGTGTQVSPYQVTTCGTLEEMNHFLGAYYILENNIDCQGFNWTPIGVDTDNPFTGVLDGNNKTIKNITVSSGAYVGVFGVINGGTVKNLLLTNINISTTNTSGSTGGLVGSIIGTTARTTISNVHITNSPVTGPSTSTPGGVGGLIGEAYMTDISNSSATNTTITGYYRVGGLIGELQSSTISNSYANVFIESIWSSGYGYRGSSMGGLIGEINSSSEPTTISDSYASAVRISGSYDMGGFVGYIESTQGTVTISDSYAITNGNAYNTGFIRSDSGRNVGGFSGAISGTGATIQNCYAFTAEFDINSPQDSTTIGGFNGGLGSSASSSQITNSFWDMEISEQNTSNGGTGEITSAMKDINTFTNAGWNFDTTWHIDTNVNAGYPFNLFTNVATVTSSSYTISTNGTTNETITNVPFGGVSSLSKADFLANITKGDPNQTWNTTAITDPVTTGSTLVVTAQDGTTVVTYTITVNPELNHIATITSSTYTVSAGGTANETISGVPEGTAKADLLAALTKGNPNQTWNDGNITDPLSFSYTNTLIVTAQDGVTVVTYTITPPSFPGDGDGSLNNPYQISTCDGLEQMNRYLSAYFILETNVDCQGVNWAPIGTDPGNFFSGVLDGNNKTVSNISYSGNGSFAGMFGDIEGGTIKNLTISNIVINPGAGNVGGLTGGLGYSNPNPSTIDNVHITSGSVNGSNTTGGLIGSGYNAHNVIKNSSANVSVTGTGWGTGGLIGIINASVDNCSATGPVNSNNEYTGGLIGYAEGNSDNVLTTVSNSYATGDVTSTGSNYTPTGGLIGNTDINVLNSYATGEIIGYANVGGLIGQTNNASLSNSYATGSVTGSSYVGGLIGYEGNYNPVALVSNTYATGIVTGSGTDGHVGGLIGYGYGTIEDSYATGNVIGTGSNIGGLVGDIYQSGTSSIDNCHASGLVQGSGSNVGGLTGSSYEPITNSYAIGDVVGQGDGISYIGGLSGAADAPVSNSYAKGNVSAAGASTQYIGGLFGATYAPLSNLHATGNVTAGNGTYVGGLIGFYAGGSSNLFEKSFATGNVIGNTYVGGLIGDDQGSSIADAYAFGDVSGINQVGGLIGYMSANLTNSYSKGSVSITSGDSTNIGGLIGVLYQDTNTPPVNPVITSSYYDSEVSGQSDTGKGVGETTLAMKTQATYTGWDFTTPVWHIDPDTNEGYPYNYVASSDATVTSSEYTVSANGTANETISDVPSGVSTLEFLSNITKGNAFQTFNTANLSDPVVSGNTLVVTSEDGNNTVTYTVDVIHELSSIATLTSSTYTVSAGGTANETITNVPSGTSRTTLLGALTMSDANELWNTSSISDPVVSGNTLVVTSEDGNTVVTYTITVNGGSTPTDLTPSRAYYSGPDNWGVQNTKFTVSGDFNNDGKDDVAAMYDYGNGKMGIWVFESNGTTMTPVNMYMGVDGGWNVDATKYVVAGDFNNDGKEDIAAMYDYGNGFMGIWAFESDGTTFTPTRIYTGLPGGWNVSATKFVVSGDFNNDGKEDIAAMYDYGDGFMGIWAFQSDGTNLTPTRIYTGVTGGWNVDATRFVVSGDFNNDGKEDIAAMYDYGNNFMGIWAFESNGTNLVPSRIYTGAPGGWNVAATKYVVSGDFNNDGKEDIAAMYDYGNGFMGIWAFQSDGTNLTPTRIYTGVVGGWNVAATKFLVSGDYSGDGTSGLAAIYDYGNNNMGIWIFR